MKNIAAALMLVICSHTLLAQKFSVEITGGYCAPLASDMHTTNATQFQVPVGYGVYAATTQTVTAQSFGQGGCVALNLNYFTKKDIGFGIKLNALISAPATAVINVTYYNNGTAQLVPYTYTDNAFSFQFVPHISFKHDFKRVSPILEMGMIIGVTNINSSYTGVTSTDVFQSTINDHGGAMLGFYSSLGLAFKISKAVKFLLAVNCTAASYSPTVWTRTAYTVNNVDLLSALPIYEAQGVYVKNVDNTATPNQTQPRQSLKYSAPFSNVGFTAGFAFQFGKQKNAVTPSVKDKDDALHPF